jgi:hypothetical protein
MEILISGLVLTYDQVMMSFRRGSGSLFIALRKNRQPFDQTDFTNGGDAPRR